MDVCMHILIMQRLGDWKTGRERMQVWEYGGYGGMEVWRYGGMEVECTC